MRQHHIGSPIAGQGGWTLVEVMWVVFLSLLVFGAVLYASVSALRATAENVGQVYANDAVTRTLERLTREIRQATYISTPGSGGATLTLDEYVTGSGATTGTLHKVTWDCSGSSGGHNYCTRQDVTAGGQPVIQITNLTSLSVFSAGSLPSGSPATYVPITVTLKQAISGSNPNVLSETITPRDCQYFGTGYSQSCDNTQT